MRLFKHKKGSQLVEKILMAAFAVAAGGAVVVYGSNVLTNAKNTEITGILSGNGQMSQEELDVHFDDSAKTITLYSSELNNKSFSNLLAFAFNPEEECSFFWAGHNSSFITYDGYNYGADEVCNWEENGKKTGYIAYMGNFAPTQNKNCFIVIGHDTISINLSATGILYESLVPSPSFESFTSDLTWNIPHEQYYQFIKTLLISDLS